MKRRLMLALVATFALIAGMFPWTGAQALVIDNDDFADAWAISGESGSEIGDTTGATAEAGEPALHLGWTGWTDDLGGHSLWYSWTAPEGVGDTTFLLESPNGSQALGLYTGTSVDALTEVAYNLQSPLEGIENRARVSFTPTAGVTYIIGVGDDSDVGQQVTLSWLPTPAAPANDDFADGAALANDTGSTEWATWQSGEPTARDDSGTSDLGGRSVWYTYAPAVDGSVEISLEGSDFDTVLGVYTGALGSLVEVAFNDDDYGMQSGLTFLAEAGTTYHIGIGGYPNRYVDNGQVMQWGDAGDYVLTVFFRPVAPEKPTAVPGNGQIELSWAEPGNGGYAITGYGVAYQWENNGTWRWVQPDPVTATSMTFTGLTNGVTYYFRVMATNEYGDSDLSPIVSAVPSTLPGAPTNLMLYPGNGTFTLMWSAPDNGGLPLTTYTLAYRAVGAENWTFVSIDAPATSKEVPGLTNGVQYAVKLLASNANGDGPYSAEKTVTVGLVPETPNTPAVVETTGDSVTITWVDPSDGGTAIDGHEVRAYIYKKGNKTKPATYTEIVGSPFTVDASTTYTVTGLQKKYTYVFVVRAHNAVGWSGYSGYSAPVKG